MTVPRPLRLGAATLGFAIGGFFDGILLHQVLQWHHLLSGVAGDGDGPSLRFQILSDGLFHVLHYVLAALGLWLLWRGRAALSVPGAARSLGAATLIGFGAWHVLDAVLFHWVLGLHRIRMQAENLLLWDILWLVPFGVAPLIAGLIMDRPGAGGGGRAAALGLAAAAVLLGGIALRPAPSDPQGLTLAVFRPGLGAAHAMHTAARLDAALVWTDPGRGVWMLALPDGVSPAVLYRHGALIVSGGAVALGCLDYTRAEWQQAAPSPASSDRIGHSDPSSPAQASTRSARLARISVNSAILASISAR